MTFRSDVVVGPALAHLVARHSAEATREPFHCPLPERVSDAERNLGLWELHLRLHGPDHAQLVTVESRDATGGHAAYHVTVGDDDTLSATSARS